MPNTEILLRDQFVEYIFDTALLRELKHFVHEKPDSNLLDIIGRLLDGSVSG